MAKSKGIKAWLIIWDWDGDHAMPKKKIEAILNPRLSPKTIREYVELIYSISEHSFSEQAAIAHKSKVNPDTAILHRIGNKLTDKIYCGQNPFLAAFKVNNLIVSGDDKNSVEWD